MRHTIIVLLSLTCLCFKMQAQSHLADFTLSKDSLCTLDTLTVTYKGTGSGSASFIWYFHNGTPSSSTSSGPVKVTYANPAATDSVILIVNDGGVIDTQKKTIKVKQSPTAHFVFGSLAGCNKNYINVTANGSAGGNAVYNWLFPGELSDTGKGAGPRAIIYDTGWHHITLTVNDQGCSSLPYMDSIYIYPLPVPSFKAKSLRGCVPFLDSFYNLTTNGVSYQWKFGDSTVSSVTVPYHRYSTSGYKTVELIATSAQGCIDSLIFGNYIDVVHNPVANFNSDPLDNSPIELHNACVTFYDQSTYANHYKWKFGDTLSEKIDSTERDTSSASPKVTHCFRVVGTDTVCLYSYNYLGCVDSVCHVLVIIPNNEVFIPNTFTPNGDARNDRWLVYGPDIDRVDMKIYDRWGELVYYSADFFVGWDGTFNNKPANTGVYSYVATVYRTNNRIEHYKGGVTLIR